MTLGEGVELFLSNLRDGGYSSGHIERQRVLLKKSFQYGIALHHPDLPRRLTNFDEERLAVLSPPSRAAVGQFLQRVRSATESVRYFNLAALVGEHPEVLSPFAQTLSSFLETLGASVDLRSLSVRLVEQVLQTPMRSSEKRNRIRSATQAFLDFCFASGWLEWNPQIGQRFPEARVFEADFFDPPHARWAEHARSYLRHLKDERNLALGGVDYCARKLKPLVQWLDTESVRDLQVSNLKAFIDYKRTQGISETTLSKYLYVIRPFIDFLIRTQRVRQHDNPAAALHIKSQPGSRRHILSETELKTLIESLENAIHRTAHPEAAAIAILHFRAVRDLAMVLLFALCGLRLSEVARMNVEDVLADKKALRIHGKGNRQARTKIREILVERYSWKRLSDYLRLRGHRAQRYLWISWSGTPLRPGGINKAIHARIKEAGLSDAVSPHGLRATCASLYVKKGMDPYSLKTLLGHESLKTTMDSYARLTEEELREVWRKTNPLAGYDDE